MRSTINYRRFCLVFALFLYFGIISIVAGQIISMGEDDQFGPYHSGIWVDYSKNQTICSRSQPSPQNGIYNLPRYSGDLAGAGYPYHQALLEGLNDTLTVTFAIVNSSYKALDLNGQDVEQWFVPRVYEMWVTDPSGPTFRDETELSYRLRGWYDGISLIPPPASIPQRNSDFNFKIDIWDLPSSGRFQICMFATDNIPKDFSPMQGGYVFDYYPPQSLADSMNAYFACYERAERDGDSKATKMWLDKIVEVNPFSVPGWWRQGYFWAMQDDTAAAIKAYNKALECLVKKLDPCMPDSSIAPLREFDAMYLEFVEDGIKRGRRRLGP